MLIECYVVTINNEAVTKITTQLSTANAWRNSCNSYIYKKGIALTKKFVIDTEKGEVMYDKNYPNP